LAGICTFLLALFFFLYFVSNPQQEARADYQAGGIEENTTYTPSFEFVPTVNAENSTVASLTGLPIQFSETADYVKLNFTMFVVEFYKGTAGYNKIYDKTGNVLVYDDRIVLEYLFKAPDKWKQRGTPTGINYTKINDYHYEVTRFYTDYLGTTYNVTYIVKSDSPMKIKISLESGQTDTYRIAWYLSGITKLNYVEEENRVTFGNDQDNEWITFDWADVYQSFGNITQTSYEDAANGKKANIYFNIGIVNAGQTITVDPSIVGTSITKFATSYPFQRKTFYANGRFWVFYSNGTNMVYRTSTDGVTWSDATAIRACSNGLYFSIWFDGTYLHYAYASTSSIYYRRGTPNADGTITWSAAEQTVTTLYNTANLPMVSVDSNGYPWIGYREYGSDYYQRPYVVKSSRNDGVWQTQSGFPYLLSDIADGVVVSVIPLTNGKVLALYSYGGHYLKARLWTGSSWGSEIQTSSKLVAGYYHSAVAQSDDVHAVFLKSDTYDIIYVKYSYATNSFGTETTLQANVTPTTAPVISIDPNTNDLYVFWAGYPTANHIYYRKYIASTGIWEPTVDWITEVALTGNDCLTNFYRAYGGYVGLVYMNSTVSPYQIKFAYLTVLVGDITPPKYSLNSTNSTLAGTAVSHNLYWQDDTGLSYAIFSFDNCTGTLQNITGMSLSGTSAWSNFTVVINSTVGCQIRWCVYANDTSGNWNGTSCENPFSYQTTPPPDTIPPTYSLNSTNSTLAGTPVSHNLYWQDNVGLSGYIFSFDNCTGTLVNDTWVPMTGTGNWSNVTKIINSTVGCQIRWCVYANDTSGNWNGTSCETPFIYITTSVVVPNFCIDLGIRDYIFCIIGGNKYVLPIVYKWYVWKE